MDSIGILVNKDELNIDQNTLVSELYTKFHAEKVSVTEQIALLSLIGEGLSAQGTSEILKAMRAVGAKPILLDSGADTLGMTVGFHEIFLSSLVEQIHRNIKGRSFS